MAEIRSRTQARLRRKVEEREGGTWKFMLFSSKRNAFPRLKAIVDTLESRDYSNNTMKTMLKDFADNNELYYLRMLLFDCNIEVYNHEASKNEKVGLGVFATYGCDTMAFLYRDDVSMAITCKYETQEQARQSGDITHCVDGLICSKALMPHNLFESAFHFVYICRLVKDSILMGEYSLGQKTDKMSEVDRVLDELAEQRNSDDLKDIFVAKRKEFYELPVVMECRDECAEKIKLKNMEGGAAAEN